MANVPVLVEMRVQKGTAPTFVHQTAMAMDAGGFTPDPGYTPVPVPAPSHMSGALDASGHDVVVVRGTIDEEKIAELESHPDVVKVWRDTKIAPFASVRPKPAEGAGPMGTCPVPPCDCTFGNPANGTMADVATHLGVDQIWAAGNRGAGIVIGIVDGGITAIGRTPKTGEMAHVPHVIDGSKPDWGTTAAAWGNHGNMTSTDALGMAPDAHIYDIRISDPVAGSTDPAVSNALAGFQWAINRHASDGTPQVLSNSWGIFQQSWDPGYATDPNHPFTRKVVEAINAGILVLFAAGNCGSSCPDGRCGSDTGPSHDIWGANGHPDVMTVGGVNLTEQLVGYSSVGPAALDPNKPDFCSVTHFAGYFPTVDPSEPSDTGTSAATPIAAGVVALLKQHRPTLTQVEAKNALKSTAKDLGPAGFDRFTGAGIIRAKAAWDSLIVKLKIADDITANKAVDDITIKTQDDHTINKLADDITLKTQDDHTVNKTLDDITLKTQDDHTINKLADDVTLKTQDDHTVNKTLDDITLKTQDDHTVNKTLDDITLKTQDDHTINKALDDITIKTQDDHTANKALDDITLKTQDDQTTNKAVDDITLKTQDDQTTNKAVDDITLKTQDDQTTNKAVDDITLKTQDDQTTNKAVDDITLKTQDDQTTNKAVDDITLKTQDDHTANKALDDITTKLNDDATIKVQDDVITTKVSDDVTTKAQDDVTFKTQDDVTFKVNDDVTSKALEDITLKTIDDSTIKAVDDTTNKVADDISLKVVDDGIPGGNPPGGDPGPIQGAGMGIPFILSTPHHSMAWAAGGSSQQPPQPGAPSLLQQYEAAIASLEQQIQSATNALQQLDAQYRTLLAEYRSLGGQR